MPVTVEHVKKKVHTIFIGRGPGGRHMLNTPIGRKGWLGNPYPVAGFGREECINLFEIAFRKRLQNDEAFRNAVHSIPRNAILGCFCRPLSCHGDPISQYLNSLG